MVSSFNSLYEIPVTARNVQNTKNSFQFSLWDSLAYHVFAGLAGVSFQFSLWDSSAIRRQSVERIYLSILFMRFCTVIPIQCTLISFIFQFSLWDSITVWALYYRPHLTFNSLYEIPSSLKEPAEHLYPFNSLYEIRIMMIAPVLLLPL